MNSYFSAKLKNQNLSADQAIEKALGEIWDEFDKDKSGSLSRDEAREFLVRSGELMGFDDFMVNLIVEQLFLEVDANQDGMIAKAEMRTFLQKQQQAPTQAATQ
jgi:Ca2+-binding EF-hand superfamily protein